MKLFKDLWQDDDGFIVSLELLFISSILVIGLVAGYTNLRNAMVNQYSSIGSAIQAINPMQNPVGSSPVNNNITITNSLSNSMTPVNSLDVSYNPVP